MPTAASTSTANVATRPGLTPPSQAGRGHGRHRTGHGTSASSRHHPTVQQVDRAVGDGRHARVVRDHDDGLAGSVLLAEELDHGLRRRRVERTGRLVGEQERGPVRERSADRHALLLASGERARHGVGLVGEAERAQELGRAGLGLLATRADEPLRQIDVGGHVQMRDQVVLLEDVADLLAAEDGPGGNRQPAHLVVAEEDGAAVRVVESAEEVEQRGLATAARAHDGHPLARLDGHRHAAEHGLLTIADAVGLRKIQRDEQCCHDLTVVGAGRAAQSRTSLSLSASDSMAGTLAERVVKNWRTSDASPDRARQHRHAASEPPG